MRGQGKSAADIPFALIWAAGYAGVPPLGHVLRHEYCDLWARFHALPDSKRYAESAEERKIILQRANALGSECFELGGPIWLAAGYTTAWLERQTQGVELIQRHQMEKVFCWTDPDDDSDTPHEMSFFAAKTRWSPHAFDGLFTDIAEDRESVVFFDPTTKRVLAPYDGGFDLILEREKKLRELEARYSGWMSELDSRL